MTFLVCNPLLPPTSDENHGFLLAWLYFLSTTHIMSELSINTMAEDVCFPSAIHQNKF